MRSIFFALDSRVITLVIFAMVGGVIALQVIPGLGLNQPAHGLATDQTQQESISSTPDQGSERQPTGAEQLALLPLLATFSWVNAYSLNSTLDGTPIPVDAVIQAFNPRGDLIGATVVKKPGRFGLMPLYMDDPTTSILDGARSGDKIVFTINGIPAKVSGPDKPVWTANGALLQLNLVATTDAPSGWSGLVDKIQRIFD